MSFTLQFEISGLPKMANPSGAKSTHWRYAQAEVKKWRALVLNATRGAKPPAPLERATLTLTRFSSVEPDYDGLVRGFKSVVDGLTACGILKNDKLSNTGPWVCNWEKTKPNQGKITVKIEEFKK